MSDFILDFLKGSTKVYLVGIKGVGMTALALCLDDMGFNVTGSDLSEEFVTDEILKKRGIDWKIGFFDSNIDNDIDVFITTAAHGGLNNIEVIAAKNKKIPIFTYAEFMANLVNTKDVIGVCGVGGKTTTSAMIATMLNFAKLNPSYIVGVGSIFPLGMPGHYDKSGKFFVCESDEYVVSPGVDNRPKFDLINHKILVVTNIEYDHPDVYKSFNETKKAFKKVFKKIPCDGLLVACIDNQNVRELIKDLDVPILSYGFSEDADFRLESYQVVNQKAICKIKQGGNLYGFRLSVPGRFNALNALASFVVGKHLNLKIEDIVSGIESYQGCRRRFQTIKTENSITYVDDYAHHPKEILNTINAAREWFLGRRIIVLFQPHTYSRTKALFDEFAIALAISDIVVLIDIFASAREEKDESISSEMLAEKIKKINKNSFYVGDISKARDWILGNVKKGDVVITMGAGDIYKFHNQ